MASSFSEDLRRAAIAYHRLPQAGKLEIKAIKPLANQHDLALAYSPGVAAACEAIVADPNEAAALTIRANLVAVLQNDSPRAARSRRVWSPEVKRVGREDLEAPAQHHVAEHRGGAPKPGLSRFRGFKRLYVRGEASPGNADVIILTRSSRRRKVQCPICQSDIRRMGVVGDQRRL